MLGWVSIAPCEKEKNNINEILFWLRSAVVAGHFFVYLLKVFLIFNMIL